MYVSMNWIRDFVDLDGLDLDALIRRFTLATAEVEEIFHPGREIRGVVVGKILSVAPHPHSKKLHLLRVDAGDAVCDVVCGAPNVAAGMKVPFVREGGFVAGMAIAKRAIAGVESCGMCCSERELGLSDDHEGLMELPADAPAGADLKTLYEVEDTVFEVDNKSLTNRPDLWGHYGIAREFAALTGRALRPYDAVDTAVYDALPAVPVEIKNAERLYRYSCLAIRNVRVKTSPVNLRIRLYRCGMRAINLLADLTNYVMLELGQPMHAFDYGRVKQIEVATFEKPFAFETLDGKTREINPETLMICSGGKPVAIAGIMGGLESEITGATDSFLLESANFDGVSVRKSSVALGLRTDASMRYEKFLDPEMTPGAVGRYLRLLTQIDPGAQVATRLTDRYVRRYKPVRIRFDKAYVDRRTGIDVGEDYIVKTLRSLGFGVEKDGGELTADVPSWRATKDVTIKADIIEEITRIYGYDNFEIKTARCAVAPACADTRHRVIAAVKDLLTLSFGLHEVHSYVWNDAQKLKEIGLEPSGCLRLVNSVSPDIDLLRDSLAKTLLCFAADNRGYAPSFGLFEIGSIFPRLRADGTADERKTLGLVLCGRKKEEPALFYRAKSILGAIARVIKNDAFAFAAESSPAAWQHPYNAFAVLCAGKPAGTLAVVHPAVTEKIDRKCAMVALELDIGALSEMDGRPLVFEEPSKYPGVEVDLSFMVPDGTPYAAFEKTIRESGCRNLGGFDFVTSYRDPAWKGLQSVTLRFTFGSKERTLTGEEVQENVARLIERMRGIGAELRK